MKKVTIYYRVDGVERKKDYICEETYEALFAWEREYADADPEYPPTMLDWEWEDFSEN